MCFVSIVSLDRFIEFESVLDLELIYHHVKYEFVFGGKSDGKFQSKYVFDFPLLILIPGLDGVNCYIWLLMCY